MKVTIGEFLKRWSLFASPSHLRVEEFFDLNPIDFTEAESDAFEQRKRKLLAGNLPPVGAAMTFAALVFWPLDAYLFADYPQHLDIFGQFRIFIGVFLFLALVIAWRTGLLHRAPEIVTGVVAIIGIGATGWFMARLEGLDGPWFTYLTASPLMLVLIPTGLRARVIINFSAMGAAWLGVVLASPDALQHVWRDSIAADYLFTTVLGIMTGHIVFLALRASVVLYTRLDHSRRELEALSTKLESLVTERTTELREVLAIAEDVRERERTWVVQEIHDVLGQELLAVSLSLDLLRKQISSETAARAFGPVEALLSRAGGSVRRILRGLSATLPEDATACDAIGQLVTENAVRAGINATFQAEADRLGGLSRPIRDILFRIAQEAMTNVVRHAEATDLTVRLMRVEDLVRLEVEDNGRGIDADSTPGLGMAGIRQRANDCGGSARWTVGADARGTCLTVEVPCHP